MYVNEKKKRFVVLVHFSALHDNSRKSLGLILRLTWLLVGLSTKKKIIINFSLLIITDICLITTMRFVHLYFQL